MKQTAIDETAATLATAAADERAGRWNDACDRYRSIVAADATDAHALHRWGVAAFRAGRPQEGLTRLQDALRIEKTADRLLDFGAMLQEVGLWEPADAAFAAALRLAPLSVDGAFGRGAELLRAGRIAAAAAAFRRAVTVRPDLPAAYANCAAAAERAAETAAEEKVEGGAAAVFLTRLARLTPGDPDAWNRLGAAILRNAGPTRATQAPAEAAAAAAFRAAVLAAPDRLDLWRNLAATLGQRRGAGTETPLRRFAALLPGDASAMNGVGNAFFAAGKMAQAEAAYAAAARIDPADVEPALNCAEALRRLNRPNAAAAAIVAILRRAPDHLRAWRMLGRLHERHPGQFAPDLSGAPDAAQAAHQIAAALVPTDESTLMDLAAAALRLKRPAQAAAWFGRILALVPDNVAALSHMAELRMQACDWDGLAPVEERLLARVRQNAPGASPFVLLATAASPDDQRRAAAGWARLQAAGAVPAVRLAASPAVRSVPATAARRHERVRVGYLSSDFREHAVARLMVGMLEAHDRDRFAIHAYCINPEPVGPGEAGPLRRRIAAAAETFVPLAGMSDAAAAQRIADDRIDVLVDVNGYTAFARTGIMACRPAPTQVNWLGHPGGMAADYIDYLIADRTTLPPQHDGDYAEAVVRLPHCYQPNDRERPIDAAPLRRADHGLPEDGFVFCCFNNLYKISRDAFAVWMRLLRAVDGSVLWLLEGWDEAAANLRRAAAAAGVAPERIVFAPFAPPPQHLARHRLADLFLDTAPYNAHTTGSDALWAGLPVLTFPGRTFAGRVGASLVAAAGLPELAVGSAAAYEATALALARDPARLAALKVKLAAARPTCPLFDPVRFARNIEAAFTEMDVRRRRGEPPRAIDVIEPVEPQEPPP